MTMDDVRYYVAGDTSMTPENQDIRCDTVLIPVSGKHMMDCREAGFISMEWLPAFVNFRRNGYDFDAGRDDELANIRYKRIMDCFGKGSSEEVNEYTGL